MHSNTYTEIEHRRHASCVERNPKAKSLALKAGIFSAALLVLGGCGGGGDGGSAAAGGGTAPQPTQTANLTGKAIDGYLANAKVCFDDGKGGCDASLPSTTTDATGAYTLNAPADATGRQINVIVTPNTRDLSNPDVPFTSTFTLSAIVSGTTQNVTPLTTMVVTHVKAGLSQDQALQITQNFVGAAVDPAADYISGGDTGTAAIAASMVSHLTTLGGQGPISWTQVQATMKAYAAKGTVTGVQQADVSAQLNNPAYSAEADATAVLSSPLFTVNGNLMQQILESGVVTPALTPVRENFTLSGSTLSITQEAQRNGSWLPATPLGSYDGWFSGSWISLNGGAGACELKADGSWTGWLTAGQMHPSYALSSIGATLVGTDPITNDGVRVSYRTMDVSGQPLSTGLQIDYRNPVRQAMTGTFAPGTTAYLATITYNNDRVMLINPGFGLPWINGQTVAVSNTVNGSPQYTMGDPAQAYSSIQQVVGTQTDIGGGCVLLNIKAGGVAEIDKSNKVGCNYASNPLNFPVAGSWSVHPRNPNTVTITFPKTIGAPMVPINDRIKNIINADGSLVVGLMDSKLLMGYALPAGSRATVAQFRADVVDAMAASMREAAIRIGQKQNP